MKIDKRLRNKGKKIEDRYWNTQLDLNCDFSDLSVEDLKHLLYKICVDSWWQLGDLLEIVPAIIKQADGQINIKSEKLCYAIFHNIYETIDGNMEYTSYDWCIDSLLLLLLYEGGMLDMKDIQVCYDDVKDKLEGICCNVYMGYINKLKDYGLE